MKRHQASLPKLGLADQQAVVGHVGDRQLQGFGDPQPGGREQCDQGRIGQRAHAAFGPKPEGGLDQAIDLLCRVDVRWASRLAGAEVIGRRQLMAGVVDPDIVREAADSFQPRIALRHGWAESCPVECRLRVDASLPTLGRERGKALQQAFRILHREAVARRRVR